MNKNNSGAPVIHGRGISKVFRDFWGRPKAVALDGLDITVERGTIFGLLGPNGAGKSTLMKILLGHLYPSHGQISVLGHSPKSVEIKRIMGYLPERTAFYTSLTAVETLRFFASLLGLTPDIYKPRIDQLLAMVGLEQARNRMVGEYSHGMRKRLGLAQALLNDPDLLLLDEPTAGMDPIGCREIKDLILTLGKRGKTIVFTSHLLADIQDVCETIMIIYGGRVQAVGSLRELLARRDEVLLTLPSLPEDKLTELKRFLHSLDGRIKPEFSAPIATLEEYFLSVVSEAQRRRQGTSGAQHGSGVAAFLMDGIEPAVNSPAEKETHGGDSSAA